MPSAVTRRTIKPRCWPPAKTKTGTHHFLTYDGAAAPRVFLWGDEMWSTPGAAGWAQLLSLWIERKEQRAISSGSPRKKSSGARSSETTPFDPTKPHAHTGGLPVVN